LILTSVWRPGWSPTVHTEARGRTQRPTCPRRVRPYCLLDWQGAQAPIDYLIGRGLKPLLISWLAGNSSPFVRFGDFPLFLDAAKSWWKIDPLAVIQSYMISKRNFFWPTMKIFFILRSLKTMRNSRNWPGPGKSSSVIWGHRKVILFNPKRGSAA
jgi:hypothetical protein